jgi:hypothetical protein
MEMPLSLKGKSEYESYFGVRIRAGWFDGFLLSQERQWGAGLDSRGGNDKKDFSEAQGDSCSTSLKDLR